MDLHGGQIRGRVRFLKRHLMPSAAVSVFAALLLLAGAIPARAQGGASIGGAVIDASGSTIPGATVKIKNAETGAVRSVVTDDAGRYEAPLLEVGSYEVSAEKAGFQVSEVRITLVLGQRAAVDLTLSVEIGRASCRERV